MYFSSIKKLYERLNSGMYLNTQGGHGINECFVMFVLVLQYQQ